MGSEEQSIPVIVIFRLAEYHCLLSEILKSGGRDPLTSREIAAMLNLSEEIVRKDLTFLPDEVGTPGRGYDPVVLYNAISKILHVDRAHYVVLVGSLKAFDGLARFFPAERFGFLPAAVFSENPNEKGLYFDQLPVHFIEDIPKLVPKLNASVAIIATDVSWVRRAVELLGKAGIEGVLNLTPAIVENVPDNMYLSQILLPCELKLVVYHTKTERPRVSSRLKRDIGKRAKLKRQREKNDVQSDLSS